MHPIYRTDVTLLPTVQFLYIQSTNILFNYFFRLSLVIFVYSSTIYIGQMYLYSPQYTLYIFSQQIYLIISLEFLLPSSFIRAQNIQDRRTATPHSTQYSPEYTFYIFSQQIYLNIFFQTFCRHLRLFLHEIYRTDVPLLPTVHFLYIQSTDIFNYSFGLCLAIFVYSSTKFRVFPNFTLLGS